MFEFLFHGATFIAYLCGGVLLATSLYIVIRYLQRWRKRKSNPLPLHVWTITVSYVLIVLSILVGPKEYNISFWFYIPGFVLGTYALWTLTRLNLQREKQPYQHPSP